MARNTLFIPAFHFNDTMLNTTYCTNQMLTTFDMKLKIKSRYKLSRITNERGQVRRKKHEI